MKKNLVRAAIVAVAMLVQGSFAQSILYQQNFDSYANGSSADSWYGFFGGGGASTPGGNYVTNYLGSQTFGVFWDSTLDGSSYQYAGIGGGNGGNGIIPASAYSLSQITLSLDLAENGSTSPNAFVIFLDQYNPGQTWQEQFNPTTSTDGSFTTVSFTLASGTGVSGTYNPALPVFVGIDSGSGFANAPGNAMIVDNVLVTAVPEPASLTLAGLGGASLLLLRHRRS
jgi:hypothetical protein